MRACMMYGTWATPEIVLQLIVHELSPQITQTDTHPPILETYQKHWLPESVREQGRSAWRV